MTKPEIIAAKSSLFRAGMAAGSLVNQFSLRDAERLEAYLVDPECDLADDYRTICRATITLRKLLPKET